MRLLEAQNEARAPSKKLGMQERQYSVDDMRQMMRLKLTGQARSAKVAAEQVVGLAADQDINLEHDQSEARCLAELLVQREVQESCCQMARTQTHLLS